MNKIFTSLVLSFYIFNSVYSQSVDCSGGRYYDEIFSNVDVQSNITYGQNINVNNQMQSLEMDIYSPQGDVATNRPVIILAHGGSFYGGTKESPDIVSLCNRFAKMGYVAVSMEYRLESIVNVLLSSDIEKTFLNIVYDAVSDQKAAIRFLRKSVAVDGNPYGINPNIVMVGGVSAGSILSIHTTFLDDTLKFPSKIDPDTNAIEGNSGNPGYWSVPQAVINLCGAIGDTLWLEMMDQPMVSVHTEDDNVVPYNSDIANPGIPIMLVHGSNSMNKRANNLNLTNPFLSYSTGGHCGFLYDANQFDSVVTFVKTFTHDQICFQGLYTENEPNGIFFSAYPNPTVDGFYIDIPGNTYNLKATLMNLLGQVVWSGVIPSGQNLHFVSTVGLKTGMYVLNLGFDGKYSTQKIMVK